MKQFVYVEGGVVCEIHDEFVTLQFVPSNSADAPYSRDVPINERFHPEYVATLVEVPAGAIVKAGDSYLNGVFGPPAAPVVTPPTASQVLAERSSRLAAATREIDPLQDLIDLGESTPEDEDKLLEWKTYRAAVSKVQTQAGYPESVVWPQEPAL